jgi:hypothetical protein
MLLTKMTIGYGQKRAVAAKHVLALKQSALIVVLKTGSNQIAALETSKQTERIAKLKAQYKKEQQEIIISFNDNFSFCPVYFVLSTDLQQAKLGNFEGILLNDSLQYDTALQYPYNTYYFCSVGDVYFESFGTTMDGIAIYDNSYKMLEEPFPYYLRRHYSLAFVHRSTPELIMDYNNRLAEYAD